MSDDLAQSGLVIVQWKQRGVLFIDGWARKRGRGDEDAVTPGRAKALEAAGLVKRLGRKPFEEPSRRIEFGPETLEDFEETEEFGS